MACTYYSDFKKNYFQIQVTLDTAQHVYLKKNCIYFIKKPNFPRPRGRSQSLKGSSEEDGGGAHKKN